MVKHIVFWKVKDNDQKQQNIDRMIDMLKSLVGKIEGLTSMEVGYNFNNSSDYDVVLCAGFTNPSALRYYQTHPEHVKCKDFISQVTVNRVGADYFFESDMAASAPAVEIPVVAETVAETPAVAETVAETPVVAETAVETPAVPEIAVETYANPFGVEINTGSEQSSLPSIQPDTAPSAEDIVSQVQDVQPSVQGYNPQIKTEDQFDTPKPDENYQAPDLSYIKTQGRTATQRTKFENNLNEQADKDYAQPLEPLDFSDVPPAAPMKFNPDSSSYSFGAQSTPKPARMQFNDTPVSTPVAPPARPASRPMKTPQNAQVNPVSTEHSRIKETTNAFGKKKIDVDVTPLDQRSDVWTCPNCGKIMPNYVGTCGCGEVKPFDFGDDVPAAPMTYQPAPQQPAAPRRTASTPMKTPQNAQVNPVSTEHSKIKETTNAFGKKKIDVDVTPLDQRSDVWTCPNCGKIMPNYVGTCGCGEVKPFDFGDDVPAAPMTYQPAPQQQTAPRRTASTPMKTPQNAQVNPVSTEHSKIKETTNAFGKKKIDVDVTPLEQRADVWTCPNCGKIMPNYVGTCGCGEVKPFDFGDDVPAAPMTYQPAPQQPAAPRRTAAAPMKTPQNAQVNPVSTEHSKIKETTNAFGKKKIDVDVTPLEQRADVWTCPNCGKIMPNYVGTCGCGEVKPFDFGDDVPAAPMTYQPAPQQPAAPRRTAAAPMKTPQNAQVNPVSTEHSKIKETTNAFGKKKIDVDVTPLEQRSDVWTCPNCGKIMPNYVGTCGCGEVKPFDFGDEFVNIT